jgi:hypothetical protein
MVPETTSKFQVSFSTSQREKLAERAAIEDTNGSEILRRALEAYSWLRDEQARGRRILSVNAAGNEPKELRLI